CALRLACSPAPGRCLTPHSGSLDSPTRRSSDLQFVPNSDLVTTEEWMEGDQRNVLYTIAEDANYSDGTPVTCDDFLLSFTAGQMQELFGSNMTMMDQVESVACAPENKKFLVKFQPGQGGQWRSMFGPGTVMPAHKIAERAEISREELVNALYSQDP